MLRITLPGNGSGQPIYQWRVDRRADGCKNQDQHATRDIGYANALLVIDGKGAWRDNHMIERLWRSLKYECVYLNAFETGSEMRVGIGKWLTY